MKRFKQAVAILLMTSTLAAMAGCSFTSDQTNKTEITTQATYLIGSPGKSEEFEFGVTGINSFDVTTDYGETMHYLLVSVSYTNLSDKEQDISKRNIGFYLDNEEIFSCEYRDEFKEFFEEGLLFNDKKVNPGRTKRGYIVYRIYRDFSSINVCMNDVTVTAAYDEVVPLISQAEIEVTDQTQESETVPPETTIETTIETVVATETTVETTVESSADSAPTESASTE